MLNGPKSASSGEVISKSAVFSEKIDFLQNRKNREKYLKRDAELRAVFELRQNSTKFVA